MCPEKWAVIVRSCLWLPPECIGFDLTGVWLSKNVQQTAHLNNRMGTHKRNWLPENEERWQPNKEEPSSMLN